MREIKFRAWDSMFKMKEVAGIDFKKQVVELLNEQGESFEVNLNRVNIRQFTGLLDKNGKEIYEGDVVSLEGWMPKEMQICFIEGAFCLANKKGEYVSDIHYIQHAGIKCAEIVGNIYDNPELLEEQK